MSKGSRPTTILAFTDSACSGNPGPAGIGVVLVCGDRRKELSEYIGEATSILGLVPSAQDRHPETGYIGREPGGQRDHVAQGSEDDRQADIVRHRRSVAPLQLERGCFLPVGWRRSFATASALSAVSFEIRARSSALRVPRTSARIMTLFCIP
jgi:hypothetical protein